MSHAQRILRVTIHEVPWVIEAHMKIVLDMIVVAAWVVMSLAVVSLVGHYRKMHAHVGGPDDRDEYRADRDMALQAVVLLVGVLSAAVVYTLNRVAG